MPRTPRPRSTDTAATAVVPEPANAVTVEKSVTILRPVDEVFGAFHDLSIAPRFLGHVHSVTMGAGGRARWVARLAGADAVEWDTDVVEDGANGRVRWEAVAGSEVQASGFAEFRPAPGNRGTEVKVRLSYAPPLGRPGRAILKLLGEEPKQEITRDLYRLRQILEAGVIATTEGQPSGRRS